MPNAQRVKLVPTNHEFADFSPDLALAFGPTGGLIIQTIWNEGGDEDEGYAASGEDWHRLLPYFSRATVGRALAALVERGAIHRDAATIPARYTVDVATVRRIVDETPQSTPTQFKKVPIPADVRWAVWERDNFTCQQCGSRRHLAVDHIFPESKGGPLEMENLQTLCRTCNLRKGARV